MHNIETLCIRKPKLASINHITPTSDKLLLLVQTLLKIKPMARSVDYLRNAYHVYYIDGSEMHDEFDWDDFMLNLKSLLTNTLPSLDECESWDGRETKIFLENSFCEVGVSEYCGLISVSFRWHQNAEYQTEPLFENWFDKIEPKITQLFKTNFSSLHKIGTFSNGESIYELAS